MRARSGPSGSVLPEEAQRSDKWWHRRPIRPTREERHPRRRLSHISDPPAQGAGDADDRPRPRLEPNSSRGRQGVQKQWGLCRNCGWVRLRQRRLCRRGLFPDRGFWRRPHHRFLRRRSRLGQRWIRERDSGRTNRCDLGRRARRMLGVEFCVLMALRKAGDEFVFLAQRLHHRVFGRRRLRLNDNRERRWLKTVMVDQHRANHARHSHWQNLVDKSRRNLCY
jgi:hypothetical protein